MLTGGDTASSGVDTTAPAHEADRATHRGVILANPTAMDWLLRRTRRLWRRSLLRRVLRAPIRRSGPGDRGLQAPAAASVPRRVTRPVASDAVDLG